MWYALVTFGSPSTRIGKVYRTLDRASVNARRAMGSGSCTAARVLVCDTRDLARTADISRVRPGEQTIYST